MPDIQEISQLYVAGPICTQLQAYGHRQVAFRGNYFTIYFLSDLLDTKLIQFSAPNLYLQVQV